MNGKWRKHLSNGIVYALLIATVILIGFPLFYAFVGSFKSNAEIFVSGSRVLPEKIIFDNYVQAWQIANFSKYTINSVFIAFFSVIGNIITVTITGYVFDRGSFPGKKLVEAMVISSMFVSLGSLTLYPVYTIAKWMHLNKSLWGIIIIRVFGLNVTSVLVARSFIKNIPSALDEAATLDGCSFFSIFYRIIFPLCKPLIATIAILEFRAAWNDYLLPMVFTMTSPDRMPLSVGIVALKNNGEAAASWNLMLAGTVISLIPMVTIYIAFNRYFIEGLTAGAVKG